MTLKQAHKECEAIWEWLSKNSNEKNSDINNKITAGEKLNINIRSYKYLCPYCEYVFQKVKGNFILPECEKIKECPIVKKYKRNCNDIGYQKYSDNSSKENAKEFYDKIKDL